MGAFHDGQYHAGHYRSVGSHPELRFDEDNVHKQCAPCNNHKSGDVVNYRINLVAKIGAAAVARLEGPHERKEVDCGRDQGNQGPVSSQGQGREEGCSMKKHGPDLTNKPRHLVPCPACQWPRSAPGSVLRH
ncbi:recombination protein NinG [Pseudomonas aeruginosa]|uniref:recombination protein NinG n=1 Tax=Pseudomonas aeruginosa TaxID=287 RepID=UPI00215CDCEA|nr:recombination protein NinG [Pseudomonas aeruginosa]